MAITPVNITRVSQNMQGNLLVSSMQKAMVNLLHTQEQLATGLSLVRPSDNPVDATAIIRMEEIVEAQKQYLTNIENASSAVSLADANIGSMHELVNQAYEVALENLGSTATAEERNSAAIIVDSILNQLVNLGNTEYLGSFLFAGQANTAAPFEIKDNNVWFYGDFTPLTVQVNDKVSEPYSITADELFGVGTGKIEGYVDLSPAAELTTRLSDLKGALGEGIRLGTIKIIGSVIGEVKVDLTGSATVGDIIDKINDALPASVSAALSADGRRIEISSTDPTETLQVLEEGTGTTAHDLGIYTPTATLGTITGSDFNPKLTLYTKVSALVSGMGIDTTSGIIITNGEKSITLDFSTAQTLQDILNAINSSGVGVRAQINSEQNGIEIINMVSGASLYIAENGGTTAEDLGIRTLRLDTRLSSLNCGRGVDTVDGADITIQAADGSTIDVDLTGALTIADVIDRINIAAAGKVTAEFKTVGNGIVLIDNTMGSYTFRVSRANLSNAAYDLGILKESTTGRIEGDDINPIREESIFTYLVDLREGLAENDPQKIEIAAQNIERYMDTLNQAHGKIGYIAKGLETRKTRMEDAILSTENLLSNLKDLDYASAITRLQNYQAALQAALTTGGKIMQATLLDYL